jgi:hypothetical protein
MMNYKALSFFVFGTLLCSSCKTYLTPSLPANNMSYMAKPMVADEKHTKIYVHGAFAGSESPSAPVTFEMGMLNVHRSHTYQSINFSYGVFGYLGSAERNYTEDPDAKPPTKIPPFKKQISGFGLKTSIGYHLTSGNGNTDFRLINWENSLGKEGGSYSRFRQDLFNTTDYRNLYVSNQNTVWTTGLSTEIIWHARKRVHVQHAFRAFFGTTPGLKKHFDREINNSDLIDDDQWLKTGPNFARSFSYFLTVKQLSVSVEAAYNFNTALRFSLGYAF